MSSILHTDITNDKSADSRLEMCAWPVGCLSVE